MSEVWVGPRLAAHRAALGRPPAGPSSFAPRRSSRRRARQRGRRPPAAAAVEDAVAVTVLRLIDDARHQIHLLLERTGAAGACAAGPPAPPCVTSRCHGAVESHHEENGNLVEEHLFEYAAKNQVEEIPENSAIVAEKLMNFSTISPSAVVVSHRVEKEVLQDEVPAMIPFEPEGGEEHKVKTIIDIHDENVAGNISVAEANGSVAHTCPDSFVPAEVKLQPVKCLGNPVDKPRAVVIAQCQETCPAFGHFPTPKSRVHHSVAKIEFPRWGFGDGSHLISLLQEAFDWPYVKICSEDESHVCVIVEAPTSVLDFHFRRPGV